MNRNDFIRILEQYGLEFFRHGSRHDIYIHIIPNAAGGGSLFSSHHAADNSIAVGAD